MKDSGIEWIGDIPSGWNVTKHKWVMQKEKQLCKEYSGEDIISLTMKGIIKRDLVNPSGKMPASFDGYQRVRKGNLLLCLFDIDVTPRCVGLINDDGLTSPAYSQYKMLAKNFAPYYDYLLRTIDDRKDFLHLSKNLRSSLKEDDFGNICTIKPPIEKQKAIAGFLDYILPEIESIVERTKSTIEDYKLLKQSIITEAVTKGLDKNVEMKDSGIEWIGEMPQNWRINKLKYCGELSANGVDKKIRPDEKLYRSVHYTDVYRNSLYNLKVSNDFLVVSADDNKAISTELKKGDILLTNSSETPDDMGHSTLIADDFSKILQGYHLMRFRPNLKLCGLFLKYFLGCHYSRNWFSYRSTGITRYGITKDGFAELKILIPPIKEQEQIGKYLEKRCSILDDLISKKLSLIEELEIFKKSLIYEYVTGKKEVE